MAKKDKKQNKNKAKQQETSFGQRVGQIIDGAVDVAKRNPAAAVTAVTLLARNPVIGAAVSVLSTEAGRKAAGDMFEKVKDIASPAFNKGANKDSATNNHPEKPQTTASSPRGFKDNARDKALELALLGVSELLRRKGPK